MKNILFWVVAWFLSVLLGAGVVQALTQSKIDMLNMLSCLGSFAGGCAAVYAAISFKGYLDEKKLDKIEPILKVLAILEKQSFYLARLTNQIARKTINKDELMIRYSSITKELNNALTAYRESVCDYNNVFGAKFSRISENKALLEVIDASSRVGIIKDNPTDDKEFIDGIFQTINKSLMDIESERNRLRSIVGLA